MLTTLSDLALDGALGFVSFFATFFLVAGDFFRGGSAFFLADDRVARAMVKGEQVDGVEC